ncbi:MAG: hypothetical protein UR61_C0053G0006 [candidate division WS6 bacterium GW2011_GWE1_34_7]|uniref:Uncharacterized protein n=1 Tax=candidate division WS6 bacterium GW2011_GWE1_34_7 TaxID=1619093 RepID=A0A0G0B4A2_9BACT|nr:MAG: hypothetical protein UR61_C0053G0006 [candidate division WS6 bacterium GW2011_GWE1_34_7]
MEKEQLEGIEGKINELINTFPTKEKIDETHTTLFSTDKYWYDETVKSASSTDFQILSKYAGGIFTELLAKRHLQLNQEAVETISNLLIDAQVLPPNTQILKFDLGFDQIYRGINDTTSSVYLTHGEFIFNEGLYPLLDTAGLTLLNYPFSFRFSKYNNEVEKSVSISLPKIEDRLRGLRNFRLEKEFFEQLNAVHHSIQKIKDLHTQKYTINQRDIILVEFLMDVILSKR